MALSERLAFILSLDADGAIKGFQKVGSTAEKELGKTDQKLDKLGGTMTKVGAGMVASAGIAAVGLFKMAGAAAEDEAAQVQLAKSLQNTTGATKDQVAQVEKWISSTQRSTGVLDDQLRPALATQLRATKDVTEAQKNVQLAMDISQATGKDLETVSLALGKAYLGNVGGLQRLGISVKDASGETLSWTEAQKQLNAQFGGATAASLDTAEGKVRLLKARMEDLKENIGAGVIPVLDRLSKGAEAAFNAFDKLGPEGQKAAGTFATMGVAAIGTVGALSAISGQLIKMRHHFTTTSEAGVRSLNKMGKAAQAAGIAMAAFTVIMAGRSMNAAMNTVEADAQALARATGTDLVAAFDRAHTYVGKFAKIGVEFDKVLQEDIGTLKVFIAELERQGRTAEASKYNDILAERVAEEKRAASASKEATAAIEDEGAALEPTKEATAAFNAALKENKERHDDAREAMDDFRGRLEDWNKTTFEAAELDAAWNTALRDWAETVQANGPVLDTFTEKGNANREATQKVTEAVGELIAKAAEDFPNSVADFRTATNQYVTEWEKQLKAAGFTKEEINNVIGALNELRNAEAVNIQMRLIMDRSGLTQGELNAMNPADIAAIVDTIPGAADGAYVKARPGGTLVRVGEGGRDEIIAPVGQVASSTPSGAASIVVNNPVFTSMSEAEARRQAHVFMDELRRIEKGAA